MTEPRKAIILGSTAVMMWSTVATAFKIALAQMTPYTMLTVAATTAMTVFALWLTVSRGWKPVLGITSRMWLRYAMLGLLMPLTYYLMLFKAYDLLPAQIAQPVNYTWPIILVLLLRVFKQTPIPAWKFIGMGVSLGGVVVISSGGDAGGVPFSPLGLLLTVGSALLWGLFWLFTDDLKSRVAEPLTLFLTFMFGSAYLWLGHLWVPMPPLSQSALGAGLYIGLCEMGIPFICFGLAIRKTDNPALINQLCYLAPFASLFIVSIILGERIMPTTYIGLPLIIAGLLGNELYARRLKAA